MTRAAIAVQIHSEVIPCNILPRGVSLKEEGGIRIAAEHRAEDGRPTGRYLAQLVTEDGRTAMVKIDAAMATSSAKDVVESVRSAIFAALKELGYDSIEPPHTGAPELASMGDRE